eukprot:3287928-Rhodomonas_salina.2
MECMLVVCLNGMPGRDVEVGIKEQIVGDGLEGEMQCRPQIVGNCWGSGGGAWLYWFQGTKCDCELS